MLLAAGACCRPQRKAKTALRRWRWTSGFGPMDALRAQGGARGDHSPVCRQGKRVPAGSESLHLSPHRARVRPSTTTTRWTGSTYEVDDVIFDLTGNRTEKVVFAPQNTLQRVMMSPSDLQDIQHGYPFVLTAEDIGQYKVEYVGRQKGGRAGLLRFRREPESNRKEEALSAGPHLGGRNRFADRGDQRQNGPGRHAQGE